MLPLSAAADMNSRAASRQFYMSFIKPRETAQRAIGSGELTQAVASELHRMFEGAGEAAQRRIGHSLVPMVKSGGERFLAIEHRNHRAEDGRHPQHHGETALKADTSEHRECGDRGHSQTEANDHLRRFRRLRQVTIAACYKRGHDSISSVKFGGR
jgi:hypothetical protein